MRCTTRCTRNLRSFKSTGQHRNPVAHAARRRPAAIAALATHFRDGRWRHTPPVLRSDVVLDVPPFSTTPFLSPFVPAAAHVPNEKLIRGKSVGRLKLSAGYVIGGATRSNPQLIRPNLGLQIPTPAHGQAPWRMLEAGTSKARDMEKVRDPRPFIEGDDRSARREIP
jgi:hypothetical protein